MIGCSPSLQTVDAIIAPATPSSALALGTETMTIDGETMAARPNVGMFTQPISFVGLPVAAVPIDCGSEMPIGIQIIAAPWREDICLRVAAELERSGIASARHRMRRGSKPHSSSNAAATSA